MLKIILRGMVMSLYGSFVLRLYLDLFLQRAEGSRRQRGWIPFLVWQCLSEIEGFPANVILLLTSITIVWVGITAYDGSLWSRCLFPIVYLEIWMLLEGVADFGIRCLSGNTETGFLTISILSKILLLVVILGIKRFAKKKDIGKEPYTGGISFIVMPILGMMLYQALYSLLHSMYIDRLEAVVWMLVAGFSLIFLNLSFYPIYSQMSRNLHFKKSEQFYIKQMELFQQEKAMEEEVATEIREIRHNMKQHRTYLEELVRGGNLDTAKDALAGIIGETDRHGRLESRTGNMVVDSLVNNAWKSARESGISFHAEIGCLPELAIKDTDLCVLLGNALDNALEASAFVREGKKEVWVVLNYVKGCLFLQVRNYYEGEIKMRGNGKIRSSKMGKGHGFGLYSMEKIAAKYHGYMNIKPCDGIFKLEILMKNGI